MVTTSERNILWLDDPSATDVSLVGGKAANLSALAARHPVPPGYAVVAPALGAVPQTVSAADSPFLPDDLLEAIAYAYLELGAKLGLDDPPVAVRSSGVDEDGSDAAFPGQFDTLLNISGAEAVCGAVQDCWASSRSERVAVYRRSQGIEHDGGIAVLVQHLVAADSAAVAFSVNPVTGDRDEVMINANYGLGESIVGGTATPDTYVVRKADLVPAARTLGSKERMTVRTPAGTRDVGVPVLLRASWVLDDAQIAEIARLAVDLEAVMGRPVDIECAYEQGRLFLLQCRPITTLR